MNVSIYRAHEEKKQTTKYCCALLKKEEEEGEAGDVASKLHERLFRLAAIVI